MPDPKEDKNDPSKPVDIGAGGAKEPPAAHGSHASPTKQELKDEASTAGRLRAILAYGNTAETLSALSGSASEQGPGDSSTTEPLLKAGLTADQIKWERDVFRDVLSNVNQTLRFQIQLAVPLLAACVTVLNLVPPQEHQMLLNDLDRWVFIPVLISVGVAYKGLEFHWYSNKTRTKLGDDIQELYHLVRFKHHMVRIAILFQAVGLILLMVFVLLEYK